MPLVIALAGRRIDAADTETSRFPLANVPLVRDRLRAFFAKRQATGLVCSGACGADLVALEVAEGLEMRRRVVLPFVAERFKVTSVVDRPGNWGALYDRIVAAVRRAGDLIVLERAGEGSAAYEAANKRIIEEALALAECSQHSGPMPAEGALAVIAWEGCPRGPDDATQQFANAARARGLRVEEARTV